MLLWTSCLHRKVLLSGEILPRKYFRFFSSLAGSQEFGAHEYSRLFFILCSQTPLSASQDTSSPGGWKNGSKRQPQTEARQGLKTLPCSSAGRSHSSVSCKCYRSFLEHSICPLPWIRAVGLLNARHAGKYNVL